MLNKAGSILLSKDHKKTCLVYRSERNDYSFPKGHIEGNESYLECALRETEEETGEACKPIKLDAIGIVNYTNKNEGNVRTYMYLLEDCGKTTKVIPECEQEIPMWVDLKDVPKKLTYQNLIEFWESVKNEIEV